MINRQKALRATTIKVHLWGATQYDPPSSRSFLKEASDEYDKITIAEEAILRKKNVEEFNEKLKKGEVTGLAGAYSLPRSRAYKAEREKMKADIVNKRIETLKMELTEAIKKCKKVDNLPACKTDIEKMLNFVLQILGVKPRDITLMVTEDLFYQVVKQVPIEGKEKKAGHQYYL